MFTTLVFGEVSGAVVRGGAKCPVTPTHRPAHTIETTDVIIVTSYRYDTMATPQGMHG